MNIKEHGFCVQTMYIRFILLNNSIIVDTTLSKRVGEGNHP